MLYHVSEFPSFFFNLFYVLIYLFLAALGLCCGMQDLHCGMRDLFVAVHGLFVVVCGLLSSCGMQFSLSSCGAWAPERVGSVVAACGLSCGRILVP